MLVYLLTFVATARTVAAFAFSFEVLKQNFLAIEIVFGDLV